MADFILPTVMLLNVELESDVYGSHKPLQHTSARGNNQANQTIYPFLSLK